MNVTAHQEKKKNKETKKGKRSAEKRKRENRRPILRKLCAALLRLFRGQQSEKMKGSAWGSWDPPEVQQPFRPNPNGSGPHYHVEAAVELVQMVVGREKFLIAEILPGKVSMPSPTSL